MTVERTAAASAAATRRPGRAAGETVRALLIDPEEALERRLADELAGTSNGGRFRLDRVDRVAEAVSRIGREGAEVVLLPLPGPDPGVFRLIELRGGAPEVPVVALAAAGDEPLALKALQLGAADYLITDQLYGTLLARCLLHAVEAEKVRARLARDQEEWTASVQLGGGEPQAAAATLRAALPDQFAELVADYRRILDQAVEQVLYRVEHPVERSVRRLAQRAGDLRAGPRDVIEIHAAAVDGDRREHAPQRARLQLAEGRVRLLELMGHLVTYYRRLSVPAPRRPG